MAERTLHCQMAKATKADIDAAIELYRILSTIDEGGGPALDVELAGLGATGYEECETQMDYIMCAFRKGGLFRVVWGMAMLTNPRNCLIDPRSDTLDVHPAIADAVQKAREALAPESGADTESGHGGPQAGPECGHSACSQNYIDTGDAACVEDDDDGCPVNDPGCTSHIDHVHYTFEAPKEPKEHDDGN